MHFRRGRGLKYTKSILVCFIFRISGYNTNTVDIKRVSFLNLFSGFYDDKGT